MQIFSLNGVFLYLTYLSFVLSDIQWDLLQIQFVARHGERTPIDTFPLDPFKNTWQLGLGQLTEKGALQHQELGKFLRRKYKHFIPRQFHKDLVYIRSTDCDRTILSALNCMQGLFGETFTNNKNKNYIPKVPIHTVPKENDHLLKTSSNCPAYETAWNIFTQSSSQFQSLINPFNQLQNYVMKHSGWHQQFGNNQQQEELNEMKSEEIMTLDNYQLDLSWKVCDTIKIWPSTFPSPSLPNWVDSKILQECEMFLNLKHFLQFLPEWARRLRGGPFIKQMLTQFYQRVSLSTTTTTNNSSLQLIGYFAHDSTLAAILSRLEVHNGIQPPLASAIIIEFYRAKETTLSPFSPSSSSSSSSSDSSSSSTRSKFPPSFAVRFLYRNNTNNSNVVDDEKSFVILKPPGCQSAAGGDNDNKLIDGLCLLGPLDAWLQPKLPNNILNECGIPCDELHVYGMKSPSQISSDDYSRPFFFFIILLQTVFIGLLLKRLR